MTVYIRTERGQQAAYDSQSEMPRKLKSLLKVIDGKTSNEIFEQKLRAFGDVRSMLHSLNSAGLITPVMEGIHRVRENSGLSEAEREHLMQPRNSDEWSQTRSASTQSFMRSTHANSRLESDTVALPGSSNLQSELKSARALQSATSLMGSFILTHMPEQSFQILKELEELSALEMLAVMLSGYEQMIAHVGEPSVHHLRHIKQILRENL